MPFTLSHASAALPIWLASGRRLRADALAIGALTPDYEYFVALYPRSWIGHSPLGLLLICLPAGWLTLVLFDRFGRAGLASLLPVGWRLPPVSGHDSPLWCSAALLAGAASHVLWDTFTHEGAWGVQMVPVLASPVTLGALSLPGCKLLQHASTLGGIAVLAAVVLRWAADQPRVPWSQLSSRALAIATVLLAAGVLNGARFASAGVHRFLVGAGVAVALVVIAAPVLLGLLAAVQRFLRSRAKR